MKVAAVVHAKGKSERLPDKNLRKLGGKPLICHAIMNACSAKLVDDVYIDSENDLILKVGAGCGAIPLKRPPYLANNEITGDDLAYWQAQSLPQYDILVQVVPTSPFTKPETIDKCIDIVISGGITCFTMTSEHLYTWSHDGDFILRPDYYDENDKIINSNSLDPYYIEHTGVYAFKTEFAFKYRRRTIGCNFNAISISPIEKIDINTEEDFEFAEIVWKGLHSSKTNTEIDEDSLRALVQASIT